MPGLQCSRCGRLEGEDALLPQRGDVLGPADDRLSALVGGAWASIDGQDVCPNCQTRAERMESARRIVSAIEAEVNRSAALDPSKVEPGLVMFAMQLREALSFYEEPPPGQAENDDTNTPPGHIQFDVAITGAFLTGCPLRIGIAEYRDVQRKLASRLAEYPGQGWRNTAEEMREGTYYSGGGFSQVLPLVLVCRDGDDALARAHAILNSQPKNEHDWLDRRIDGWNFTPTSMRIEVYDLGVAVINGTFDVGVPTQIELTAAVRTLKEMVWLRPDSETNVSSPITGMFRKLSMETTREFQESVAATVPDKAQQSWLPQTDSAPEPSQEWGRLLWLHPVHMLASADPAVRKSRAKELAPAFSKTVKVPEGRFVSGIGWSAIVTDIDRSARDVPMRLLQLHWAYIALYMEIDRGLLAILDKDESSVTTSILSELEDDASRVFNDYIRVMEARARVDSALASLGGDEQAIWDVMADVTKFDALVQGVDRKVEVLQRIAERRVQEATSESTRRTARILGFLTTITLVTLSLALLGYFYGGFSDDDHHHPLRWVFLGVGLVVAVILWYWTFGERRWRRKKPRN